MAHWVRIARVDDFRESAAREIVVEGQIIALFCVEGQFYALDGICPHQGGPLAQGSLTGCVVTCPWHGWQYDVRTGQHQSIRALVHRCFPLKVENGEIYADLEA